MFDPRTPFCSQLRNQLEFLFSDVNFNKDIHLHLLQDENGYVPLEQARTPSGILIRTGIRTCIHTSICTCIHTCIRTCVRTSSCLFTPLIQDENGGMCIYLSTPVVAPVFAPVSEHVSPAARTRTVWFRSSPCNTPLCAHRDHAAAHNTYVPTVFPPRTPPIPPHRRPQSHPTRTPFRTDSHPFSHRKLTACTTPSTSIPTHTQGGSL